MKIEKIDFDVNKFTEYQLLKTYVENHTLRLLLKLRLHNGICTIEQLMQELTSQYGYDRPEILIIINTMKKDGIIYSPCEGVLSEIK